MKAFRGAFLKVIKSFVERLAKKYYPYNVKPQSFYESFTQKLRLSCQKAYCKELSKSSD